MIDISYLKDNNLIIFEGISGSKAYGLDTPDSDTDIRGVFVLPKELYYGFDYMGQVNNETNDVVYYELKKFLYLARKNNPNVMEMFKLPEECILIKDPLFDRIKLEDFLSKLCRETFAGYALNQVKRARGLNKKIMKPVAKEKKGVLDFCFVTHGFGTIQVEKWLEIKGFNQENCGLSRLNHFRDSYALFHKTGTQSFQGIVRKDISNDVCLSTIPEDFEPETYLYFNRDGYIRYLKDYREYWNWVKLRNEDRYQSTIDHGKNYDTKNMMHTFRLLAMAEEIARNGDIQVRRFDRDHLLAIKNGEYTYEDLVEKAQEKIRIIKELFDESALPQEPDTKTVEEILVSIRKEFYKRSG